MITTIKYSALQNNTTTTADTELMTKSDKMQGSYKDTAQHDSVNGLMAS